jgi:hypothetical protein
MNTLFRFNPQFDILLAGERPSESIINSTQKMAPFFLPALESADRLLCSYEVDDGFYSYLAQNEISSAKVFREDEKLELSGEAWGVDKESEALFSSLNISFDSPDVRVVERINSRAFGLELAKEFGFGTPQSEIISSITQFENINKSEEFVVKPIFGNSAFGFIHSRKLSNEEIEKQIEPLLETDGSVIYEPWLDRVNDLATLINISKSGDIKVVGHHQNLCSQSGSFYGDLIVPNDPLITPYKSELESMAQKIGTSLFKTGYWGVVGVDSFIYIKNGKRELALAIDINGRHPISSIAYSVLEKVEKIGKERSFLYRFISKKRHKLPQNYSEFTSLLGDLAFSTKTKRGVILLSPIKIVSESGDSLRSPRSAFGVVGDSEEDVLAIDEQLREILK